MPPLRLATAKPAVSFCRWLPPISPSPLMWPPVAVGSPHVLLAATNSVDGDCGQSLLATCCSLPLSPLTPLWPPLGSPHLACPCR